MDTVCLLYRSTSLLGGDGRGIRAILDAARRRNRQLDLTGYLHHEDGSFWQWLEGPSEPLEQVAALIERDPRHRDMRYLFRGAQGVRRFPDWRMGYGASEPGTLFQWVADTGVSPQDEERFARSVLDFLVSEQVRDRADAC